MKFLEVFIGVLTRKAMKGREQVDHDEFYVGAINKDPLVVLNGPITRSRAKKIKEAMAGLVQSTWAKLAHSPSKASTFKDFKEEEPTLIHVRNHFFVAFIL